MPPDPWKTLSSREIYRNPWMRVREDLAEMPNGRTTIYGVCEFAECVGIVPFLDDDRVVMVRQYRYVFGESQRWEIPTGGMLAGEQPEVAAQRELMEEIGYRADSLTWLNTNYTSKSICREVAHLYLGRGLTEATAPPDDTEFIELGVFPFEEVYRMVLSSEIRDSMSAIAILLVAQQRQQGR